MTDPKLAKSAPLVAVPPPSEIRRALTSPSGLTPLVALLGLVVGPGVASATDLAPGLPPELGAWGLVVYALIQISRELVQHLDGKKRAEEERAARERAEARVRELERLEEERERGELTRLREEVSRLKEGGR